MDEQDFDIKDILHKALLAKTRLGKVFKTVVFWVSLMGMFVIPLGAVVLYFLWKHGNELAGTDPEQLES